jgi:hypothetical protein
MHAYSTDHSILLVFDRLNSNFGKKEVMEKVSGEMGFDGQSLSKELLVEVFPRLLAHQDAPTTLILCRSAGAAHHLQHVHNRIVDVTMLFAFVVLNTHDDDHVTGHG